MPGPVAAARPPRVRLDTLNTNKPAPRFGGRIAQTKLSTAATAPPPLQAPASKDEECRHPNLSEHGNSKICDECGAVVEDSEIVAEITFGETSSGAAVVQGGFVGEGQRHANTMGGTVRGMPGRESRQKTQQRGQDEIAALCHALHLHGSVASDANQYYKLSLNHHTEEDRAEDRAPFGQGRRVRSVAAVCIYLADRKRNESTLLLMDLAEKIKVNVFALGHTYKELLNMLGETDPGNDPRNNGNLALHLEPLVEKFCKKLEFGPWDMMRVASDATLLLKRMNRDWMVQGRSPAGIIGACIILAARMNNYRRTVREVVYVVRVADSTLNQRLHEFKRTDASNVSVQRFRKEGVDLRYTIAPPAVYKREAKEYKKRKRAALDAGLVWDSDKGTATGSPVPSPQNTTPPKPSKSRKKQKTNKGTALSTPPATQSQSQLRQDAEGFAIPPVPSQIGAIMDPESHEHQSLLVAEHGSSQDEEIDEVPAQPELPAQSKKRGRPRNEPIVVTDEERKKEEEIEAEIKRTMEYWQTVFLEFRENPNHPILVKTRNRALKMVSDYMPAPSDYANENDAELDADPDVANCKNSPEEVALKEKIWITENEEWLRRQQQKILRKELEEASGKKKVVRRRRHHQLGDGSLLEGRPAATAAEAARVMNDQLAKNRGFSGAIDYEALYSITRPGQPNAGESPDDPSLGTPSATAGASPASGQAAQQKDKDKTVEVVDEEDYGEDEDAEGDWDEAYEEQPGGGFMDPTLYAPIVEETPLDDEDALDNWT